MRRPSSAAPKPSGETVCVRLPNAHTVSLLELKTARSLVSYIINRQSWLHWETLICIYSVFIQKTFDREHKTQYILGQL